MATEAEIDRGCGEWIELVVWATRAGLRPAPTVGDWRWFAPTPVAFGLWPREIEECDIGEVLHAFEDNFTAVLPDVESRRLKKPAARLVNCRSAPVSSSTSQRFLC